MIELLAQRKTMIASIGIFLFTIVWAFFFNDLSITPDSLLRGVGNTEQFTFLFSLPFAGFVLFFSLTIGVITAFADKDERTNVYVSTIIPSILACAISAILFPNFAQWYPLSLFYFGSIPLMIETSRIKRMELKNFAVPRSNFAGAQRGLQVMGIGILVTLAIVALPQNASLYESFEQTLFSGKIVQQVNIEKLTTDLYINTQKTTMNQIVASEPYQQLRATNTAPDAAFVSLIEQTQQRLDTAEYRQQVREQIQKQQAEIDPDALVAQLEQSVPGYQALKKNYWAVAAFLSALLFFMTAFFVLQPLSAMLGTGIYSLFPTDGSTLSDMISRSTPAAPVYPKNVEEALARKDENPTDISSNPKEKKEAVVPDYSHMEEVKPDYSAKITLENPKDY